MKLEKILFKTVKEKDGKLTFLEGNHHIPFEIKRVFQIYGIPSKEIVRANHASSNTFFVLQVLYGSVDVELDDGKKKHYFNLKILNEGVLVPPMTWMKTMNFSKDAILQVYASKSYQECEYIEDYEEFKRKEN